MWYQDDLCATFTEDGVDRKDSEEATGPRLRLIALETLLNRRPSRRKRLLYNGLLFLALGALLITFAGVIASGKSRRLAASPLARATLLISSNVTAGTITINGHPQGGSLPLRIPMPAYLPARVTLVALPFHPVTCQFPPARQPAPATFGSCLVYSVGSPAAPEMDLHIYLTLSDLPLSQQVQLCAILAHLLTIHQETVVPDHDFFATHAAPYQMIASQRAPTRLWASTFLVSDSPAVLSSCGTHACRTCAWNFCTVAGFDASAEAAALPGLPSDPPDPCATSPCLNCADGLCYQAVFGATTFGGQLWSVAMPVRLGWRFGQLDGTAAHTAIFPETELLHLVMSTSRQGSWQLAPDPEMDLAEQLTAVIEATGLALLAYQLPGLEWSFRLGPHRGIAGSELIAAEDQQDQARFLWRFGVLLAADAGAHRLAPALPVAPLDELAAVGG